MSENENPQYQVTFGDKPDLDEIMRSQNIKMHELGVRNRELSSENSALKKENEELRDRNERQKQIIKSNPAMALTALGNGLKECDEEMLKEKDKIIEELRAKDKIASESIYNLDMENKELRQAISEACEIIEEFVEKFCNVGAWGGDERVDAFLSQHGKKEERR